MCMLVMSKESNLRYIAAHLSCLVPEVEVGLEVTGHPSCNLCHRCLLLAAIWALRGQPHYTNAPPCAHRQPATPSSGGRLEVQIKYAGHAV